MPQRTRQTARRGIACDDNRAMPVTDLDHYFIRARDLQVARHFYCELLGFEEMPRPDLPFPGMWLGVHGKVQVHLGLADAPDAQRFYLGTTANSARDNAGVVDHIVFRATDPQALAGRLRQAGLPVLERDIASARLFQILVADPDGLMIELNFADMAERPGWSMASQL